MVWGREFFVILQLDIKQIGMGRLIADSGSTKTSWVLVKDGERQYFETLGINPVRDSGEAIEQVVDSLPPLNYELSTINFFGAGCIEPYSQAVREVLEHRFPKAEVHVESDLLGAAHALCGHAEGIACILGTGSNSCLYDGEKIAENVSPLGWILGDEGSGAVLGRLLVGNVLKRQFSPALCSAFEQETGLTRAEIINKVYREQTPNRFLAALVPFLGRHRDNEEVHGFLVGEFRRFIVRNVASYGRNDLQVSFVGGVANAFSDELTEALRLEGLSLGRILKRPIDGIADYLTT